MKKGKINILFLALVLSFIKPINANAMREELVYLLDIGGDNNEDSWLHPALNCEYRSLCIGDEFRLKVFGGDEYLIEWKSRDESIATVSNYGLIKAKKAGRTKIIAYYEDEYMDTKRIVCELLVSPVWASEKMIEKDYPLDITHPDKKTVKIIKRKEEYVTIKNVPAKMTKDKVYGKKVHYKYDGKKILYNVKDIQKALNPDDY